MKYITGDYLNKCIAVALGARVKGSKIIGYECPPSDKLPEGGFLLLDNPQEIPDYISRLKRQVED